MISSYFVIFAFDIVELENTTKF